MINAEIECKKSLSPVSRKCYLNREWTRGAKVNMPNLDTYRKLAWPKHGKVRKSYTLLV